MASIEEFTAIFPWISTKSFIIGALMRILSGPALTTAISEAGGLGFIGPGAKTLDTVQDLDEASHRVHSAHSSHTSRLSHLPSAYDLLPHASDLEAWTVRIRSVSPSTQIWIQIGTVDEVQGLLQRSYRPDVLVVQGLEAGSHGHRDAIGLITILPEVVDMVEGSGIKIVASGGITDGRGVSAALCLGATEVAMGTRILASTEVRISQDYQQEVIRATNGGVNTVRTLLYNHLPDGFRSSAAFDVISDSLRANPTERKGVIRSVRAVVAFTVKGSSEKEETWHLDLKDHGIVGRGSAPSGQKPDVSLYLSDDDFATLFEGKTSTQKLFMKGKLKIRGNILKATKIENVLRKAQTRTNL
ncbi:hypothetical protein ABOM_011145 [Aspergillus bombycis]|uniref:SCP2 domain-containing protein n=1 Tax=Aspergillus bombycis TaxID=109264 RepID=A0A1F7ZMU5_9EURO|nr:hypothetical protein ABOM_011145 [Aspergillus bombycis]OGM40786.1 hypothetical protein ABOM_011145 [Aspergillus bombycis]